MRIITAAGKPATVSQRSWPLAGINAPHSMSIAPRLGIKGFGASTSYVSLYKSNPWVNAAVRSISWGLSRMPFDVFMLDPDGQREPIDWRLPRKPGAPSAAIRLDEELNTTAPLDRGGPQRRMRRTMTDYLIHGNALWAIEDDGLWHVPWRHVRPIEGEYVEILGFEVTGSMGKKMYAPEQVIHFCAGDDPDGPLGVSPMESLSATLQLHDALQKHLVRFFENSARPSANVKLDKTANAETVKLIRDQVRELYTSPENAGKVIVTTGDFQPMTAGHDQSQIIDLAKQSREEIAAVYRIPMPVLGVLDHAIKSNVSELRQQYVRDVIGAWAPAVVDDIMAQRVRPDAGLRGVFVEFDQDSALSPDLEGMAEAMVKLERTMTTNERRRKINLRDLPYPEADTVPATPGASYLGIKAKPVAEPGLPGLPAGKNAGDLGEDDEPITDDDPSEDGDQPS